MAGQTSEVEETLKRLQGHKGVIGVVIVNQDGIPIRSTFAQAETVQYAGLITQLCSKARSAVRELDPQVLTPHARRMCRASCPARPRSRMIVGGGVPVARARVLRVCEHVFPCSGRRLGAPGAATCQSSRRTQDDRRHRRVCCCARVLCCALMAVFRAQNDLTFLRLRSKKHEIMVAPDKDYLLIIIQDPNKV